MTQTSEPVVGVVMGSDSDLDAMRRCLKQLDSLGVAYEVRVISAHRTPDAAHEYAAAAAGRGLKVIVAAAGMSAALAGVMASTTGPGPRGVTINELAYSSSEFPARSRIPEVNTTR